MGKVLLIESSRVLRQAITLFLFPEHEVKTEEEIEKISPGALKDYDLLIVDGGGLREQDRLTPQLTCLLQSCKTPILWLEGNDGSPPFKHEKFSLVRKPLEREALRSALDQLLAPPGASKEAAQSRGAAAKAEAPEKADGQRQAEGSQQEAFQFVDLVDVVEGEPSSRRSKKSQ